MTSFLIKIKITNIGQGFTVRDQNWNSEWEMQEGIYKL